MSRLYISDPIKRGNRIKLVVLCTIMLICFSTLHAWAQIPGSRYNPTNAGNYGSCGSMSFMDYQNNDPSNGFGDTYGQSSDDVWYTFTVTNTTQINISLCGSNFDTYLHLLDGGGNEIAANDDNGPLCSGLQSSIQITLSPGTYSVAAEGYSYSSGDIAIEISCYGSGSLPPGATLATAIDAGSLSTSFTDTEDNSPTSCFQNYMGQLSNEIYYKFTLTSNAEVSISHCGTAFDTYMHLLDNSYTEIAVNDDNGPLCTGLQASIKMILTPGTYYVVSEGFEDYNYGNLTTSISAVIQSGGNISGSIVYSVQAVDPESRTLDLNYPVGSTQGALSVSPAGNSTYTIPIELPELSGGLKPSLALVYSSMSGNGSVGSGWQISGLSAISRGPQNFYNDWIAKGVNLDANDRFMLDGQRLLATSGTYGSVNTQYHTENDIFTRVTSLGTSGTGPEKFKAESKSGLVYEYGYSPNAIQKFQGFNEVANWYANKISDCYGNQITFTYINVNGEVYPTEINYGSNQISLFYKERTDKTDAYFKGVKITQSLLLDKIEINYAAALVKKYEFKYSYLDDLYNGYSLLNEVIEYGTNGSRFNSTAFSYKLPNSVNFIQTNYNTTHNYVTYSSKLCTGDFNGDGIADFVCLPDPSKGATWTGMRVYFGDGNDNFNSYFAKDVSIDITKLKDTRPMDINGDGIDDLLYEIDDNGTSSFYYMLCDGSTFSDPVLIQNQTYGVWTGYSGKEKRNYYKQENDNEMSGADYDGDGINDIFLNAPNGMWRILSFGNGSGQLTTTLNLKTYGTDYNLANPIISTDFNGDGKAEIWSINANGIYIYALDGTSLTLLYSSNSLKNSNNFILGDFNGDGKTDIFVYGNNGSDWSDWQIRFSTGTGFTTQNIPQKKANLKDDYVRLGDFNGDGCTDLMVSSSNNSWTGTYFYISKEKGTDFYTHTLPDYPAASHNYYVADYNGDGKSEFICTDGEYQWWDGYQIYKSEGNNSILLDKVSNGLNQLTKIEYAKLSQPNNSVYLKESNAAFPVFDYQGPFSVVSSVYTDNGLGGLNTINYTYKGAKIHRQGKGLLCFSKTTTTNVTVGTATESRYTYNQTYYYPQLDTIFNRLANEGAVYETTINNWTQKILDGGYKRILPYVAISTQTNNLTGLSLSVHTNSVDDYGNSVQVSKSFSGGRTEASSYVYSNIESSTEWRIGRLDQSSIAYYKNGVAPLYVPATSYSYSSNGIVKPDHIHYLVGSSLETYKDINYDSHGNLIHVTEHNSNGDTRETSYTYDSEGKNVATNTDPLGHTTTYSYDSYGRLASQQDYLSNSASFGYDDFGRQTSESRPDGSLTSTSYLWNGTDKPSLAAYGVMKTSNNGATSIVWNDKLSRGIRTISNGFDGTMILGDTQYNNKGQAEQSSEPYFSGGTPVWTYNYYDSYGRISSITRPTGRNTSYSYTNNTVSETTAGKTYDKTYDSDGSLITATDNGGTINYTYYSDGKVKTITSPDAPTSMQYNIAGNQTQLNDPSAGTINYTYDGFGQLLTQTDAKNQLTTISYLPDGRVNTKITPEGTYAYTYNANKQLSGVTSPSSISRSYNYDNLGRIVSSTETIQGSAFTSSFTFDNLGRIATHTLPSGITETNTYNTNGYLFSIAAEGATRHTVTSMNARGQMTAATYGNSLTGTHNYDSFGYPTTVSTGSIRSYEYNFNAVTGNLNWRKNNLHGYIQEDFAYDNLDRLSSITRTGTPQFNMTYFNNGNIINKSDIDTINFGYNNSAKPYAITNVSTSSGIIPVVQQTIGYNSFEKINSVTEGDFSANFVYNGDNERCKMEMLQNGTSVLTRWYIGSNYIKELSGSTVKEYSFIGGDAYTAPVVAITQGGTTSWYYLLRDHLGSLTHVVNASNDALIAEYSYDAWGRRRNPTDWSFDLTGQPDLFAGRGFTGHETMTEFGLINMNGRLYDPAVGRFLSPDPYVQMPDFTQNLNRYTYGLNNPLKYTDPSGDYFVLDSWIIGLFSGGLKEANKRAGHDIKIWGGLFTTDPNKSFFGQIWEVVSRFTWQLPQTIGGWGTAQTFNEFGLKGGVESVSYKYGATVVTTRDDWTAVTQGSYIVGGNSLKADANNSLFQHEYGHYIQSQSMGWAYYPRVGIPSARSEHGQYKKNYPSHDFHPVEQDANRRAFLYFNKHIGGFQDDVNWDDNKGWNFIANPLDVFKSGNGSYIDYRNPNDLQLLNNLRVSAKWYDYASWLFGLSGAIGVGLINSYNYNH